MKRRPTAEGMRTIPHRAALLLLLPMMLLFFSLVVGLAQPPVTEKRIALVIGISAYQNAPVLANPVNDAQAIGDALRRLNFDVQELYDPDFRALSRGLREFGVRAQGADAAVVYYAGHGVQVDHENFLIPADAKLEREHDLAYEALPLSLLLGEVSQATKIGIVLLDSCRNNPFTERVARSLSVAGRAVAVTLGMARVDNVPRNTMVVMAAKADQIAEDGQGHSPFAAAILAHLQIPGLELGLFFRSVRDTVLKATQNRQEPYVFSSLGADPFYFYPRPPNRSPVIGPIPGLQVSANAGPTPVGIPRPTDPDQDLLTVRIIGLPHSGEVRVEGRPATSGEAFSLDHFMTATFKPDGQALGPVGTLDILVEDGRGGSVIGSLPITVLVSNDTAKRATVAAEQVPKGGLQDGAVPGGKAQAGPGEKGPQSPTLLAQRNPTEPNGAKETGTSSAPIGSGTQRAPTNLAFASPLPTPDLPAPNPPFGLVDARALAAGVPCTLLDVREGQTPSDFKRLYVSGFSPPGAQFDAFLRELGRHDRAVVVAVDPLDASDCPAVSVVADSVRRSREQGPLRLTIPEAPVAIGGQLVVSAEAIPHGALYLDLYAPDGSVQHLRHGTVPGGAGKIEVRVSEPISGPPGKRLLVAIVTPAPLNLDKRPPNENQNAYLPLLHQALTRMSPDASELRAQVVTLTVAAAARPSALPSGTTTAHSRMPSLNAPRCAGILDRVQLGEGLSDADRSFLQTSCGR